MASSIYIRTSIYTELHTTETDIQRMHENTLDWSKLQQERRRLSGEPDEQTIDRQVALWKQRLSPDSDFTEAALDRELVKLLEKIHHAF